MGRRARAVRRRGAAGRRDLAVGSLHVDLHVGHDGRAEGRDDEPGPVVRLGNALADELRALTGRRLLLGDAAVPLERGGRRVHEHRRVRRGRGAAAPVLGERLARGRPQARRHVLQLRRQAAHVHPRDARATRRRGELAELRVRQRGRTARHRSLRAAVRLHRRRRLRLDRGRREHEQVDRHAAGRAGQADRGERRRAHLRSRDDGRVPARRSSTRRDGSSTPRKRSARW